MSWPFDAWHAVAVSRFGLAPSEFWDMPLRDWLRLVQPQSPPMTRDRLVELMEANPCE